MKMLLFSLLLGAACPPDEVSMSRDEMERLAFLICGPEGTTDWTEEGPTCERKGWSAAEGRYKKIRRHRRLTERKPK